MKKSTRAPTYVSNAKLALTCSIFHLTIRKHVLLFVVGPTALEIRQSLINKKRNSRLWSESASASQNHPRQKQRKLIVNLLRKKQRDYHIWNNRVTILITVLLQHKSNDFFIFQTFFILTTPSFTINTRQFTVPTTEHSGRSTLVPIQ